MGSKTRRILRSTRGSKRKDLQAAARHALVTDPNMPEDERRELQILAGLPELNPNRVRKPLLRERFVHWFSGSPIRSALALVLLVVVPILVLASAIRLVLR